MDPFVRRLIQRLHHPDQPLSRNRHYHVFDTPEGRYALRTSRRLKSLQRDILACSDEGRPAVLVRRQAADGEWKIEVRLERISGRRVSVLADAEYELLTELPGVAEALARAAAP